MGRAADDHAGVRGAGQRDPDADARAAQARRLVSRRADLRRSGKAAGLALYVNGKRLAIEVVRDALAGPIATDAALTLGSKALGPPFVGQIDDLRLYNRVLTPGEVEHLAIHYRPRAILSGVTGKRSKEEADYLREYFLT